MSLRRLKPFGARLGFFSGFYGLLAASTIYDVIWQIFHDQLWRIQNADRIVALVTAWRVMRFDHLCGS